MHSEGGIRSPLMCRVFLEIPKKPVQKVFFGYHTSSICESKGQALQAACWGKHLEVASFFSVLSWADHRFSDFSLSWWSKEGIEQRKMAS